MKVSVITPTHNCSKFIEATIRSVLCQTIQDFEIIVIDDCSNDNTVEIIRSLNDSRIKIFINDKNMGSAFSRNVGLRHASGTYIAFLDGDDLWFPEKLEKQISFMEKNNYSFTYTNYEEIDKDGNKLNIFLTGPRKVSHKLFMRVCYVGCLTVMYKRELFPDLQIPNDIYKRSDYALWLRISERADCFLLNEVLASYRKNVGISSGKKAKLLKYHKDVFSKILNSNPFMSWIFAVRNVFFYILKKIRYQKEAM